MEAAIDEAAAGADAVYVTFDIDSVDPSVAPGLDPTDNTARLGAYLLTTLLERRFAR